MKNLSALLIAIFLSTLSAQNGKEFEDPTFWRKNSMNLLTDKKTIMLQKMVIWIIRIFREKTVSFDGCFMENSARLKILFQFISDYAT